MKTLALFLFFGVCFITSAQTTKSKNLQLKYTLPGGWSANEFGGKSPWEEAGNHLCHCSGVLFTKSHKDGKMNVLVYPSTRAGLDSNKRNLVGPLRFEDVQKYDKTKNKNFSFERKKSNFTWPSNEKAYEVFRYFAKVEDHFYIIYAWQENMQALNSTNEKEIYEMINVIEPD